MIYQYSKAIGELAGQLASSPLSTALQQTRIKGLVLHSDQARPGWGFVATLGPNNSAMQQGVRYAQRAKQAGATVLFVDATTSQTYASVGLPLVPIRNLKANLGRLADHYYGRDPIDWYGVTGTNGKSSVAHLLAQGFNTCGIRCAVVGTVYQGLPGKSSPAKGMTTPDLFELRRLGRRFARQGIACAVLECSSHGLHQERMAGLTIKGGIFTNLSADHRDYHNGMEHYAAAKRKLFARRSLQMAVFNGDDHYGRKWFDQYKRVKRCLDFSQHDPKALLRLDSIQKGLDGMRARVQTPWGAGLLKSAAPTIWGLTNRMAALGMLLLKGIKLQSALKAVNGVADLDGRMQRLAKSDRGPHYFVDYAHTPAALQATLADLRPLCAGQLWVLFGCGGGRDQTKRPEMGALAAQYADHVVLTNDNPRDEKPTAILAEIIHGMPAAWQRRHLVVETDRRRALQLVASEAQPRDVVLVAGKGHENYQEIAGDRYKLNDYAFLRRMIHAPSA